MLKRLRQRFILVSMGSLFLVLLLLVTAINFINYNWTIKMQDDLLISITDKNGDLFLNPAKKPGRPRELAPEMNYTTRFFSICYGEDGVIIEINVDSIASLSEQEAVQYAEVVRKQNKMIGYYEGYRFRRIEEGGKTMLLFLNCSREFEMMYSFFLSSVLAAVGILLFVFLLVFLFSKYAVSPIVKNIERQKRFITDASHEIKTPLASISASSEVLALQYGENEWVDNIHKQSMRLSKLVENLVTLSRLDEESPFPEQSTFSLSDIAWEIVEPFASLAKAGEKDFVHTIEDELMMHGEPDSIRQMISLLLDNAVKYTNTGGTIRFDVYKKRKQKIIQVFNTCDQLMGGQDLKKWFDRFYRPDDSRSRLTGGTGVGLSVAQAIAEAHGGTILVKAPSGKTICFQVIFS